MIDKLKQLLDWIYRRNCYFCRKPADNGMMCKSCFNTVEIQSYIPIRLIDGVSVYSASPYKDNMKKLIKGLKYHGKRELSKSLAELLYNLWEGLDESKEEYEIIPIPLYKLRQKERGFNHMELVAAEFAKLTGYKVNRNLVKRVKNTRVQYKLSMFERRENLREAFSVSREEYSGKKLLIMDDICTTGITIEEMAKALKIAGIDNLCAIVGACPESLAVN